MCLEFADVAVARADDAVNVGILETVGIDEHETPDTEMRNLLRDVRPAAARAEDSYRGALQPIEAGAEETHAARVVHVDTDSSPSQSGTATTFGSIIFSSTARTQRASVSFSTSAPYGTTAMPIARPPMTSLFVRLSMPLNVGIPLPPCECASSRPTFCVICRLATSTAKSVSKFAPAWPSRYASSGNGRMPIPTTTDRLS